MPKDSMTLTDRKACEEGFCLEKVTEHVSCVMDRINQQGLRNSSRNKNKKQDILKVDSEDLIFLYDKNKTLDQW